MNQTTRQTSQPKQSSGKSVNPLVAGAIGATVGVVAATLADAKKRKKVRDVVTNVMEDFKVQSDKIRQEATKRIDAVQQTMKEEKPIERGRQLARDINQKAKRTAASIKK